MHLYVAPLQCSNYSLIHELIKYLSGYRSMSVSLANIHVDVSNSFSKERRQYYSTKLIADALNASEHLDGKIQIIVEFDLFVPVFTYVFGEAQLNGKASLVSMCRLHEEFYSDETNDELLLQRAIKESLHELGHNFGLIHCKDWNCVMHSSQGIEEVDIKGSGYCDTCIKHIPVRQSFKHGESIF